MSFTSSATRFSSLLPSTSSVAAVSALGGNPRPCAHPPLSLLCAPPLLVSSPFHPSALSLFSSSPPRPSSTPTLFSPLLPSLDSLVHVVSAGHRQVQLAGGLTGEAGGEGGGVPRITSALLFSCSPRVRRRSRWPEPSESLAYGWCDGRACILRRGVSLVGREKKYDDNRGKFKAKRMKRNVYQPG